MQKYVLIDYQGLDLYVNLEWGSIHTLKSQVNNRWTYNDVTDLFHDQVVDSIIKKAEQEFAEAEFDRAQGPHEYQY